MEEKDWKFKEKVEVERQRWHFMNIMFGWEKKIIGVRPRCKWR